MRGAGGGGGPAGAAGRGGTTEAGGAADAVTEGPPGAGGATTAAGGGVAGRGGTATGAAVGTGGATVAAGGTGFSAAGATTSGRAAGAGAGAFAAGTEGATGGAAGGGVGLATGGEGTATGRAATGGTGGRTGGATASFCWVIAFSTSPGREMCDKSILVLISSSPRIGRAERADGACDSDEPRMWARTFSASCSSSELEWVFFSVTPTSGSASRMALLLTSSSLARSLIRTLLIRPFLYSVLRLGLHCIPHGVSVLHSHAICNVRACHDY
jgi:hypothetical protein